jgi:addiction module RelE/StbE family toxin
MKIVWLEDAAADLDRVFDYLLERKPEAVRTFLELIQRRVGQLVEHPELGRPGRVETTRELVVTGTPYIVAYRIKGERIDILAVLHAARKWPEGFAG